MADFEKIETQEQLDAIIQARLKRASEAYAEEKGKLQDQIKSLTGENAKLTETAKKEKEKYSGYDKEIEGYKSKIAQYETNELKRRIAYENNLPIELANRLNGATEEEIAKDAKSLVKFVQRQQGPLADTEPPIRTSPEAASRAALAKMAEQLTGGNS